MNKLSSREIILNSLKLSESKRDSKNITIPDYNYKDLFVWEDKSISDTFKDEFQKVSGVFCECTDNKELTLKLETFISGKKECLIFCCEQFIIEILTKSGISYNPIPPKEIPTDSICITSCEFLIAQFGTIMVSSALPSGRKGFVFADTHIVIANSHQLVWDLETALIKVQEKYKSNWPSLVSIITGPSRTANIEKTLVLGAHGPRELVVFLTEQSFGN